MEQVTCNVSQRSVTIDDNKVTCDGSNAISSNYVRIIGTGEHSISISNSALTVALQDVASSGADSLFSVTTSTVMLLFSGENYMTPTSGGGFECKESSNLTFSGSPSDFLSIETRPGNHHPLIGSGSGDLCARIVLLNGTYYLSASDAPCVGSGWMVGSGKSTVDELSILNGTINATTSQDGAAIGSGYGHSSGTSCVGSLSIFGGQISAASRHGAGLGSGYADGSGISTVGTLDVFGGNISANSAQYGAGIGSGHASASATSRVDTVNIFAGNITTIGMNGGAGIGSGDANSSATSTVSNLSIFGGDITANGRRFAAGIGSGHGIDAASTSSVVDLSIRGGNINATGSYCGAGIGSGRAYSFGKSTVTRLAVVRGNIIAVGHASAGVGAGSGLPDGTSSVGSLGVVDGTISAIGLDGAGIGSAFGNYYGTSTVSDLKVVGGNISANGSWAAGIGSGEGDYYGTSRVGSISIAGVTTYISAIGSYGAGIGSGYAYSCGTSSVASLSVLGGNIDSIGSWSAGLGAGYATNQGLSDRSISSVAQINIEGGNISATGSNSAAIGSGYTTGTRSNSTVQSLTVSGGTITLNGSHSGIGSGTSATSGWSSLDRLTVTQGFFDCSALISISCFNARSHTFATGSIVAVTSSRTITASSAWQITGSPNLYFEYLSDSSQEGLSSIPLIHLPSIQVPYRTIYVLTIHRIVGNSAQFEREVEFNASRSRGCAFSVSSIGEYSILFSSAEPEMSGYLVHDGIGFFAATKRSDNLYSSVQLSYPTNTPPRSRATDSPSPTTLFTSHSPLSNQRTRILLRCHIFVFLLPAAWGKQWF
jgi:hypothetical protein